MNYLVMEIHPAYAVVLDEEGRFRKAANLHYQVGDRVQSIVELRQPEKKQRVHWKPLAGLASLAACLCIAFFGYYQPNYTAYGTLRIQINPDVEMTLSRTERVLELEGLNEDGEVLIQGYDHRGKSREQATDELVDRAIELGYLSDGDTISITVSSDDGAWQAEEEAGVRSQLEERYGQTIVIQLGQPSAQSPAQESDHTQVVIPVAPGAGTSQPAANGGGGVVHYDDTDYGPNADGVTDYTAPNDEWYYDGVTDYEERDEDDLGEDDREEPQDDDDREDPEDADDDQEEPQEGDDDPEEPEDGDDDDREEPQNDDDDRESPQDDDGDGETEDDD